MELVRAYTYTTPEERREYRNLEKIHVCTCIWGREIGDSENKNGHEWLWATTVGWNVQVCNWWEGRGRVGVMSVVSKTLYGDSKTTLGIPF